jgi:outer membrane protein OmpA-like peptidoglycan-associated protein
MPTPARPTGGSAASGIEERPNQGRLILALGLLLTLFSLSFWGTALSARGLLEREEARRQVTAALSPQEPPERMAELFRQARDVDPSYAACEEGARLGRQGRFAEAADRFRACRDADPKLPAASLAWAEALLQARGRQAYPEVYADLRRFVETSRQNPGIDPATLQPLDELLLDLEDLLAADAPPEHVGAWTEEQILEVLTRARSRGDSRYEGPRLALRLDFRPADAYLGDAARRQLDRVVLALQDGMLIHARIQIEGYTDNVEASTRPARKTLAQQRAEAVRSYLIRKGIPGHRLIVKALADGYPLESNETDQGRVSNRRVELFNLDTKEPLWQDVRTHR